MASALVLILVTAISTSLLADECISKTIKLRNVCGTITDLDGKPIRGAQIEVSQVHSELVWRAASANDGTYSITNIPVGTYLLHVRVPELKDPVQLIEVTRPSKSERCNRSLRIELSHSVGICPGARVFLEKKK
jgi:hypothetical protein